MPCVPLRSHAFGVDRKDEGLLTDASTTSSIQSNNHDNNKDLQVKHPGVWVCECWQMPQTHKPNPQMSNLSLRLDPNQWLRVSRHASTYTVATAGRGLVVLVAYAIVLLVVILLLVVIVLLLVDVCLHATSDAATLL